MSCCVAKYERRALTTLPTTKKHFRWQPKQRIYHRWHNCSQTTQPSCFSTRSDDAVFVRGAGCHGNERYSRPCVDVILSAAGRSPQNVQVLTCCHNIYLSPCLFILYSNIKLWNKIKTFDQWADNILCCRQIREVNDYPHASLISYLSSVVYYWVFMTATVWRQCPLASTTGRSYSPPIMDIFSWCTPVKTTTMGFSQTYKTLWGTVIVFVILPHINLGLLSDYKICGDPECESKS